MFSRLTHNMKFPPVGTDVGELKDDESNRVGLVKSHIEIVHPCNDWDVVEAFLSKVFVNELTKEHYRAGVTFHGHDRGKSEENNNETKI